MPLLYPGRRPGRLHPLDFVFRGGRTAQRRPVPDRPRPVHQREHHPGRAREPDQDLGLALRQVRRLLPDSYKPQSIFASFNSQINFTDNASNPFDTGYSYANAATGVFNTYTQANKYALPEWNYKNIEWYAPGQLEGQLAA